TKPARWPSAMQATPHRVRPGLGSICPIALPARHCDDGSFQTHIFATHPFATKAPPMRPLRLSAASACAGVPLITASVAAGRPETADVHEEPVDLYQVLVRNAATTFFIRVE